MTFSADSCKCPGQSVPGEEYEYYLRICINDAANCPPSPQGSSFVVTNVDKSNGTKFLDDPNTCYPAVLPSPATPMNTCTAQIYRFKGSNSANHLDVYFKVNGGPEQHVQVDAPPDCSSTTVLNGGSKCKACTP